MTDSLVLDQKLQTLKNTARWLYIFHSIDLVVALGLFSWIPLIASYVMRPDTEGTFVYSHHTWQIRSFWLYLALAIAGWICALTVIGIPLACLIWAVAWIWKAYRIFKGFTRLQNNRPL